MREIILHSLGMRKVQTASLILSIALSVMTLFALALTYGGVQQGVAMNEQRSGAELMAVPRGAADEISDTSLLFTGTPASIYVPSSESARIASLPGVARTTDRFYSQSLGGGCCSVGGDMRIVGVDFGTDWTIQPFAHVDLSGGLGSGNVILGSTVGGDVGGTITLLGRTYTIVDKLEASGSDLDSSILLDIGEARAASEASTGLSYLWSKYGAASDLVSSVLIDIDDSLDKTALDQLENRIEGGGTLTVIERASAVAQAQSSLSTVFSILLAVCVIMFASTLLQLFARFYSCVWERKSELALYRAVGATGRQLRQLIGGELAIITGLGLVAGFAAGAAFYTVLLQQLQESQAFMFIGLSPAMVALIVILLAAIFGLLGIAAIAMPFSQLSKLDPSLAMQQSDID